jgi:hypothetical protein
MGSRSSKRVERLADGNFGSSLSLDASASVRLYCNVLAAIGTRVCAPMSQPAGVAERYTRQSQKLLPITGLWVRIPPPAPSQLLSISDFTRRALTCCLRRKTLLYRKLTPTRESPRM